jgi:hypothetical protein
MLAELRNAADGHPESREAGFHAAGFTPIDEDRRDDAAATARASGGFVVTAGSSW